MQMCHGGNEALHIAQICTCAGHGLRMHALISFLDCGDILLSIICQLNMAIPVKMAVGPAADTSMPQPLTAFQSKRDRALEFARSIPRPLVQQHAAVVHFADSRADEQSQNTLHHLEQQYLSDQQRVAAAFSP